MKKVLLVSAVLLLAVSLFVSGCGQTSTSDDENTGTITGTVTDFYSGDVISGALIMVGLGTVTAETDSSGAYSIDTGTTGTVTVSAVATGYAAKTIVCNSSTVNFDLTSHSGVGEEKYGTIIGRLVNADGTAYQTPEVVAAFNQYGQHIYSSTSTGNGYWIKDEVPIGTVTLMFWRYNDSYEVDGIAYKTGITLTESGSVDAGTLTIQPKSSWKTLSGTITPPSPMASAISAPDYYTVTANLGYGVGLLVATTSATADYSLEIPPTVDDNTYTIYAHAVSTAEGSSTYTAVYSHDTSISADTTKNFTLPSVAIISAPAANAEVSATPTFSWAGDADLYSVSLSSGTHGHIWSVLTTATSAQYPDFPATVASTFELQSGEQYYWSFSSYTGSDININSYGGAIDLFNNTDGVTNRPTRFFTIE
ncbi:carboxypeptidase regulatory-like domain-containing protein [Candidatus Margulisiibacteriota bacterium]